MNCVSHSGASTAILLTMAMSVALAVAASRPADDPPGRGTGGWQWRLPTLGGKQFWSDQLVHGDWRIQQNVVQGQHRLLDPHDRLVASGTWEECLARWQQAKVDAAVPPLGPRVVLVLHGLGRSRASMRGLVDYLRQQTDFSVLSVSYASSRAPLKDHAANLQRIVEHLEGVEELHFVAHSMGNLVVRRWLYDRLQQADGQALPRLGRCVMLAPPNQGASVAKKLLDSPVFEWVLGPGGRTFTDEWDRIQSELATPPGEFGIIAGGAEQLEGGSPLLDGKDDMIVTVEETRLAGAADFLVVPAMHTFIMDASAVKAATCRFLQRGYFVSPERRQPIPATLPGR